MAEVGDKRVLSIQSHVVHGYVGNKSATFPLQLLGFETDWINSVQFSNHTGYQDGFQGQVIGDSDLGVLIKGLKANNLHHYDFILNGYIGSASFLRKLGTVVRELKSENPGLKYVCDPVMGDIEPVGWYVPKDLLPIYVKEIVPLADVCLPNEFELGLITGQDIKSEEDVKIGLNKLLNMGVNIAVLSSCTSKIHSNKDRILVSYAACKKTGDLFKIEFPRFPVNFVGSGDVFSALILSWLSRSSFDVSEALEKTVATMQAILSRTTDYIKEKGLTPNQQVPAKIKELRLIQSKVDIESPVVTIKAKKIN